MRGGSEGLLIVTRVADNKLGPTGGEHIALALRELTGLQTLNLRCTLFMLLLLLLLCLLFALCLRDVVICLLMWGVLRGLVLCGI